MRTIEVPGGVSLVELHCMLLACFGWSGEHLHAFEVRGRSYSDSGYIDAERSQDVTVGSLVSSSAVGLSIVEAKQVLAGLEDVVVAEQAAHAIAAASECVECGRPFAAKDSRSIVMRSLYGTRHVESPRWWTCRCAGDRSTFSPLTKTLVSRSTPELALVEAKLAAHMSYPAAAGLLEELFPTGRRIHRNEIRRTVEHLAMRLDDELGR